MTHLCGEWLISSLSFAPRATEKCNGILPIRLILHDVGKSSTDVGLFLYSPIKADFSKSNDVAE